MALKTNSQILYDCISRQCHDMNDVAIVSLSSHRTGDELAQLPDGQGSYLRLFEHMSYCKIHINAKIYFTRKDRTCL